MSPASVLGRRIMNTAVFTIVSKNYLSYARTLMQSLSAAHPEWRQYVLLVDEMRRRLRSGE